MSTGSVLLVSANSESLPAPVYPLALAHLAGALSRAGYSPRQYDLQAHGAAALKTMIDQAKPDLVGVSLRNIDDIDSGTGRSYLDEHRAIVKSIRAHTDAPIVAGGSGFSIFPRELMPALGADYGIIGAGEEAVCELMEAVGGRRPASAIDNLIVAGSDCVRAAGAALPPPPLHDPAIVDYYWRHGGMIGISTKRGCPGECSYCTYPLIEGRTVHWHDPVDVVDQMEKLAKDRGVRYFFMVDSVFNLSVERDQTLCDEIARRGLNIHWGAFFTPKGIDRDYLRMLKASGLTHAELGSDSLSGRMLESYRKGFTVDDVIAASAACNDEGIYCAHYLLFGGPGETRATIAETLSNARRLEKCIIFPFAGVRIYPGTGVYDQAAKAGLVGCDADCLRPKFYFAEGLDRASIWKMVEGGCGDWRQWVLSARYGEGEPLMRRFREHGIKGPMWEYLIA